MNFSKNNHLNYWYGEDTQQLYRTNWYDILSFQVGGASRKPLSFKEECCIAAEEISKLYPDIHIGLTGGLDSNTCLETFLEVGIKPGVFVIQFPDNLNSFDSEYAIQRCAELGIDPVIVNVDPFEFVENHIDEIGKKYQIYSMYQAMHIYACRNLQVPFITVDEIELRRDCSPDHEWCFVKKEDQDMCWRRFAATENIKAINNFFTWSPELMLSFLELPTVKKLCRGDIVGKISWNSVKNQIYAEGGYPQLISKKKTWGIEKISGLFDKGTAKLTKQLGWQSRNCYIPYNELRHMIKNGGGVCQYI